MALEEHESLAAAPWSHGSQPEGASLSIERMPGFAYALEQFGLNVSEALAPLCRASSAGTIDELRSTNVFTVIGECQGLTAAVLSCAAFDARMLMVFDDRIADTVVAAVFGADAEGAPQPRARRSRTEIESALIAELARNLAKALNMGFAQNGGLTVAFERLGTLDDAYALGRRDMPAIAARLTIDTSGGPAPLTLLFPQSLLLPIRKNLAFDPSSEAPSSDPRWIKDLEAGVTKTPIAVTAILDEFELTLGDVAEFAIGQVLNLHGAGMGRVRLECAGREIFWCKLGEGDGRYSLEVEEAIVQEDDDAQAASVH
jgi:flagellar motor switch protein FliM